MEKNVFLIKWYGPFTSQKEVKEWEQEQQFNCSLYLLHGKPKFAKTREKYYCGMSIRNIYKRLQDKGHHIEEIKDRLNSIYVGYLSNLKHPIKCQILLAEKISLQVWRTLLARKMFSMPQTRSFLLKMYLSLMNGGKRIVNPYGKGNL